MSEPYTEFEGKADAQHAGKWGFTVPLLEGANVSVLTNDMPAYMAQTWTLNLLAARWQQPNGGTFAAGIATRSQPLDNATMPIGTVRLDYGVDSAMESVLFDYPQQGGTVQFHASVFRLYLGPTGSYTAGQTNGFSFPFVGGFVTPGSRGNVAADALPTCTLTSLILTSTVAPLFTWRPRRALAYRIIPLNALAEGAAWIVREYTHTGTVLTTDINSNLTPLIERRNLFIPLHPMAQGIGTETAADPGSFYYVQWLLDIG